MRYKELAIKKAEDLVFGKAPKPVKTRRGLVIGNGIVYPELNFTLPPMSIESSTIGNIKEQYRDIVRGALERARQMYSPGVVFEFETLMEMTMNPQLGTDLVKIMNDECEEYFQKHGVKSEIRLTPNDIRDYERPPKQRTSKLLDKMMELFEKGGKAGGDLFSIESTGGKEIHDNALLMCNAREVIFALSVLGVRDMQMLWKKIVDVAKAQNKIAAGDTACGFGNTAMVLAEKGFIPKVFAAFDRIATITRTLVACEQGAVGPDKDCGYEGVFLKAIAGIPISMEGKTAACAHLSPVGNIAAACADLWSNESIQNIKLLGEMAPTVYFEQLEYDVRLMNQATKKGKSTALTLQELMIDSDTFYDPQALILAPKNVIAISNELIQGKNYIDATLRACNKGLDIIEEAYKSKQLMLDDRETGYIDLIRAELSTIPTDESAFVGEMLPFIDREKLLIEEYGL